MQTAAAEGQGSPVAVSRSNSARVSFNVVSAVSASIGRGRRGSFCAQLPAQGEEDATHGEAPQRSAYSATTRDQRAALAEEEDAAGPASAPLPTRASAGAAAPPGASRKGSFLQTCESPAIAAAVTERADKVLKPLDENERVLSLQVCARRMIEVPCRPDTHTQYKRGKPLKARLPEHVCMSMIVLPLLSTAYVCTWCMCVCVCACVCACTDRPQVCGYLQSMRPPRHTSGVGGYA